MGYKDITSSVNIKLNNRRDKNLGSRTIEFKKSFIIQDEKII